MKPTLKAAGVTMLLDVRELPLSRRKGFSKNLLTGILIRARWHPLSARVRLRRAALARRIKGTVEHFSVPLHDLKQAFDRHCDCRLHILVG